MTKPRVLLISIVPPRNDCGVRIVMHRHLVERDPFELHVASNADFADDLLIHTRLELPYFLKRLRKSRLGPVLAKWIQDYENWIWPLTVNRALHAAIVNFKPDVILTLAETGLSQMAARAARKNKIPLAVLFLDWFPIMPPHYGHKIFQHGLSRRYRNLYRTCDLAICTSDGMLEVLGPHHNAVVVYPMPGKHHISEANEPAGEKFRIGYVGRCEGSYGSVVGNLIMALADHPDIRLRVASPRVDWDEAVISIAEQSGIYVGFLPPEKAAGLLVESDVLLVAMSFDPSERLFMETSFTTKFLDYCAFGKPIIVWGPDYCTPIQFVRKHGGALPVTTSEPQAVVNAIHQIKNDSTLRERLAREATELNRGAFDPDRLQSVFTGAITGIAARS